WPKAIVDMMDQCGVRTKAYRRLQELEREFKCDDITLTFTQEGKPLHGILDRAIKGRIREVETNPTKLEAVDNEIKGLLDMDFAEPARPRKNFELAHYLPVQAVFKTNPEAASGLKTRLVKDASARQSNLAGLNDVLHQGPNLLPDIVKVIFNFKKYKFALTADIEGAFQQFKIADDDRTFLRFKWPLGISSNPQAKIQEFWANRLDFGLGRMPLKKWSSNSQHLGNFIKKHSPVTDPVVSYDQVSAKFIGIPWNQTTDRLSVPKEKALKILVAGEPTKRKLLKGLASVFDPLGIIAPLTINAKILLQETWKLKLGWETPLSGQDATKYEAIIGQLQNADLLSIPRQMIRSAVKERTLHIFCDASLRAYGCVAYLREQAPGDNPVTSFIMSKARVAPVKQMTIHRLELLTALIGARMSKSIVSFIGTAAIHTHFYTDNSSVIGWIRSKPGKFIPFVANRAATKELWFSGPSWLKLPDEELHSKMKAENAALSPKENVMEDESYFKGGLGNQGEKPKKSSALFQYNPKIDKDGVIRCSTRLINSNDLSSDQKEPIILPDRNLSRLVLKDIHECKCFHFGGVNAILHRLRQNFLMIHARRQARDTIRECATCKILNAEAAQLPIANLPHFRIERSAPFGYTGCDFCGPIRYKKDSGEAGKGYILLFTCCVTRGINIQITTDLSTAEVLGALQKFVNRYPYVKQIISDIGTSFVRAAKELKTLYEHIRDPEIRRWLADSFVEWRFNPPSSPWFGRFFERQAQTIKRPLRKVLGTNVPHFRDLEVILSGIEAMVNQRPITTVDSGTDESEALSPADLMFGYKTTAIRSLKQRGKPTK
ncbi:uncharacterized protein LOC108864130, partial [Galendromus occidentalis]|uniref:Uncharacterized protein LOC108864130 n=1 Tax=Galendromus occidentalis TaxID=34638 RepID=A0AAJ7L524_9ACAR